MLYICFHGLRQAISWLPLLYIYLYVTSYQTWESSMDSADERFFMVIFFSGFKLPIVFIWLTNFLHWRKIHGIGFGGLAYHCNYLWTMFSKQNHFREKICLPFNNQVMLWLCKIAIHSTCKVPWTPWLEIRSKVYSINLTFGVKKDSIRSYYEEFMNRTILECLQKFQGLMNLKWTSFTNDNHGVCKG